MIFLLCEGFAWGLSRLGFRGLWVLSWGFAIFTFDILRVRRRLVLENLHIVYGDTKSKKEKISLGRKSLVSFFSTVFEFFCSKYLYPKIQVHFENKSFVDDVFAKKQGIYAICIHMGNWELLCHLNAKFYAPVTVVVKSVGKGAVARWVSQRRHAIGFTLVDRSGDRQATHQIFEAIGKQGIIGFIVDQKRSRGERLPFFGREASTNNSLAKLYLKKEAPLIPSYIKRISYGHYQICYLPEYTPHFTNNLSFKDKVSQMTLDINKMTEMMILQNPEEYFWLHNRWELKL